MTKDKKIYCSHCGTTRGNFTRYSTSKFGYSYYNCRKCNTDRARKYRKTESGKIATRKAVYRSVKKHWHKQLTRLKLNYAVRSGKIIRPKQCPHCNKKAKIQAHHSDYSKPLDVIWTCRQCHSALDAGLIKC